MSLLRRVAPGTVAAIATAAAVLALLETGTAGAAGPVATSTASPTCFTSTTSATRQTTATGGGGTTTTRAPGSTSTTSRPPADTTGTTTGSGPVTSTPGVVVVCPGVITGRLLDRGRPVAGAEIWAQRPGQAASGSARTDAAGRYRLERLAPGSYLLRIVLPSGFAEFHPGVLDVAQAVPVTVTALQETAAGDSTVVAHGAIGGRLQTGSGAPVANAEVMVYDVDMQFASTTSTDAQGRYSFPYLLPDRYKVGFLYSAGEFSQRQWVPGQISMGGAGAYPVGAGRTTVVNDRVLPAGGLTVGFHTAAGAPLEGTLVSVHLGNDGSELYLYTGPDGTVSRQLFAGTYTVEVRRADGVSQWWRDATSAETATPVQIVGGQTSTLAIVQTGP